MMETTNYISIGNVSVIGTSIPFKTQWNGK